MYTENIVTKNMQEVKAKAIVEAVISELEGRKGLLEDVDESIQEEIGQTLFETVLNIL